MADLYGRLQGSRGEATRCGTRASGISTTVETWHGKVHVDLEADGSFFVTMSGKHGERHRVIATGNVDRDELQVEP